jgi:hypothetical protein
MSSTDAHPAPAGAPGTGVSHSGTKPQAASAAAASATTSSNALPEVQDPTLRALLAMDTVHPRYTNAVQPFLNARKLLHEATASLQKLKDKSTVAGEFKSLPASLRVKLTERVKLRAIPGRSDFFLEELTDLRRLERDTEQKAYEILVKARQREIEHFSASANPDKYKTQLVEEFEEHLKTIHNEWKMQFKDAPFPFAAAVEHFKAHVDRRMAEEMVRTVQNKYEQDEKKKAEQKADSLAQEQVMTGAHTGHTIAHIAQKEVRKCMDEKVKPLERQLNEMMRLIRQQQEKMPKQATRTMPKKRNHDQMQPPKERADVGSDRSSRPAPANNSLRREREGDARSSHAHTTHRHSYPVVSSHHHSDRSAKSVKQDRDDTPHSHSRSKNAMGGDRQSLRHGHPQRQ